MAAWQHDAAMVHFGGKSGWLVESGDVRPLNQRPATGGAPVGLGLLRQHGVALGADAFHAASVTDLP